MSFSMKVASLVLLASASIASADPVTISFFRISSNAGAQNPAAQLSVIMSDPGAGQVKFRFLNDVSSGIAASITDVYFDDGTLLGISNINASSGVEFSQGATPSDLPNGNTVNPPFETTQGFSADSDPPASANGVNASSEWLEITFNLINNKTFADTVTALDTGELRLGMHVQAIGTGGQSDAFINTPPTVVVPLPGAAAMGLAGMLGLATIRRRK